MRAHRRARIALLLLASAAPLAAGAPRASAERDRDVERFLLEGAVIEAEVLAEGITRPSRLTLELDGRTLKAAFKTVDVFKPGVSREEGAAPEPHFTDSYQFDRAAYLVDRLLGLEMVPVVALRRWQGKPGAAIEWIAGAVNEEDRRSRGLEPPDPRVLDHQRFVMHLFDALILNTDRNLSNQLVTPVDWRLHLIDHSRSFRLSTEVSPRFLAKPTRMPRELLERLAALDEKTVARRLRGLVSRARVRALMARRDQLLSKIEQDRRRYGDEVVFDYRGPWPAPAAGVR